MLYFLRIFLDFFLIFWIKNLFYGFFANLNFYWPINFYSNKGCWIWAALCEEIHRNFFSFLLFKFVIFSEFLDFFNFFSFFLQNLINHFLHFSEFFRFFRIFIFIFFVQNLQKIKGKPVECFRFAQLAAAAGWSPPTAATHCPAAE